MKIGTSLVALAYLSTGLLAAAVPAKLFPNASIVEGDRANDDRANSTSDLTSLEEMEARYRRHVTAELKRKGGWAKCNAWNVRVRREWGSLSSHERIAYTEAVKCLHHLPSKSSPKDVPGARSRFDDFLAGHIQQSFFIHFSGYLYGWHRAFTWNYETALRTECGYRGAQPYWDWSLHADDPASSPVFDGSATSMGGNGEAIVQGPKLIKAFGIEVLFPPGTGGGCVTQGPMANWTVNLGLPPVVPVAVNQSSSTAPSFLIDYNSVPMSEILDYHPRCLTRDLNPLYSKQAKKCNVEVLLSCPNVDCLQKRADKLELTQPSSSLHAAGHDIIGGLSNDPLASPGDPAFYLHHAQLDRLWAIWQAQDPKNRQYQVAGTKTAFNNPPSGPVTLNDHLEFGPAAKPITLKDAMSTLDGEFCYRYE